MEPTNDRSGKGSNLRGDLNLNVEVAMAPPVNSDHIASGLIARAVELPGVSSVRIERNWTNDGKDEWTVYLRRGDLPTEIGTAVDPEAALATATQRHGATRREAVIRARFSKLADEAIRQDKALASSPPTMPGPVECDTCVGSGTIDDADTGRSRRCLDCGGKGMVSSPDHARQTRGEVPGPVDPLDNFDGDGPAGNGGGGHG